MTLTKREEALATLCADLQAQLEEQKRLLEYLEMESRVALRVMDEVREESNAQLTEVVRHTRSLIDTKHKLSRQLLLASGFVTDMTRILMHCENEEMTAEEVVDAAEDALAAITMIATEVPDATEGNNEQSKS